MSGARDIVTELDQTAYSLQAVTPAQRRSIIERGILEVNCRRKELERAGNVTLLEPGFLADTPALAEMAGLARAPDVLAGAGMLLLAGELKRLDDLHREEQG